ncbi:unnamed protein product [Parnassius mnemosyne]|uniref:Zinc finger PHD-type domain-containing protein n=1 Tax=Parnassius mnemosyne TaxID=213953 RepID=A0AAV1L1T6_9NEOP
MDNLTLSWGCCSLDGESKQFKKCNTCVKAFHLECLGTCQSRAGDATGCWICPTCINSNTKTINKDNTPVRFNPNVTIRTQKRQTSNSPPEAVDSEAPITRSDLRAIVEDITERKFETLLVQLTNTLRSIMTSELGTMRNEIKDLRESITFVSDQYEEMIKENKKTSETVRELRSENELMKSTIKDLSFRLNNFEQNARSNNIEIQSLPEKKEENLTNIVSKLSNVIDFPISPEKIVHCTRIAKINRDNLARPRSIIVQLATPRDRDCFLAAAIKFNKSRPVSEKLNTTHLGYSGEKKPVFVVEHLSPGNKALHAATRLAAKKNGY